MTRMRSKESSCCEKAPTATRCLTALHEKVDYLNAHFLPPGVKIVPFLDRSELVHFTTHTVMHNLTEGILLVSVILFLFLGNVRSALIVVLTIPFALLFASICLDLSHVPANLLSLGALDFGMVVDGSVVVVENIMRHISHREDRTLLDIVREGVHEVQRPVFFARASSSRLTCRFSPCTCRGPPVPPMALTVGFALFGSLIFSLSLLPVLAVYYSAATQRSGTIPSWRRLSKDIGGLWNGPSAVRSPHDGYGVSAGLLASVVALMLERRDRFEFLPHLDEGAIWARGTLAPSTGPEEGARVMDRARLMFASFPGSHQGCQSDWASRRWYRSSLFSQYRILRRSETEREWRPVFHQNKEELIRAMGREVDKIPGADWNFSQPIADNMEEAVSGVKGELAIKVFGTDLKESRGQGRRNPQSDADYPRCAGSWPLPRHRTTQSGYLSQSPTGEPLGSECVGCAGCD